MSQYTKKSMPQKQINISYLWSENKLSHLDNTLKKRTLFTNSELQHFLKELNIIESEITTPDAKTKIMSLYGHLQAMWIDNQVDALFDTSLSLIQDQKNISKKKLFLKIDETKKNISKLWDQNGLSKSNRCFIKIAILNLNALEDSFSSENKHNKETTFFKEQEKNAHVFLNKEEKKENDLLALDVCEIAAFFYQNKMKEAMSRWNALTSSNKENIRKICIAIGATYIENIKKDNLKKYQKTLFSFIQALVTYAYEIVQGNAFSYCPSENEIALMFEEAENLSC